MTRRGERGGEHAYDVYELFHSPSVLVVEFSFNRDNVLRNREFYGRIFTESIVGSVGGKWEKKI